MEVSILLMQQIAQLFIVLLMGYVVVKAGLLKASDSKVLSVVFVYLVMPCVVLNAFQIDDTPQIRTGLLYSMGIAVGMHVVFLVLNAIFKKPLRLDVVEQVNIIYSNAAALVIPLVQALLGEEYVVYSCAFVIVQLILLWTHASACLQEGAKLEWKKILTNVNLIAIVAGALLYLLHISLPSPIVSTLSSVGAMIGPMGMLLAGMAIAEVPLKKVFCTPRNYLPVALRLIVVPIIVLLLLRVFHASDWIPMAFTSMGVIVALYVAGCVDKATVFAGFGNNNVLTMAGMFIVAAGLSRTQMVNNITKLLYRVNNGSFTRVLASYILVIFLLGQFVPSLPAMFAMVYPLVISMCKQLKCSPSKMMYPIAVTVVSTSFVIEPIGPYAAWFVTQNGYLESYGWTGSLLSMWSETMVFLPTALVTLLLTIFVLPKLMPDQPETETVAITGPDITNNEALSPVREFLGYGIFIATVIGLMLGLPSWAVTMAGATAVVLSGVLDEQTALIRMNMSMVLLYAGVTVMGEALGNCERNYCRRRKGKGLCN